METIRLIIADDHTLFRDGLRALFALLPEIELVGEAATGEQVVALAERHQPDVIQMDVNMPGHQGAPGLNGIEATRRIVQASHAFDPGLASRRETPAPIPARASRTGCAPPRGFPAATRPGRSS